MPVLPPFRLLEPASLDEALDALARNPGAMPVAGGTDLLVSMKQGLFQPDLLVNLQSVPEMNTLEIGAGGATLGAGLRLAAVRDDPRIRGAYPALSQAAGAVAGPALQNRGTLGGNVCLDTRCRYYNQSAFWRRSLGGCLKRAGSVCRAAPGAKRCFAVSSADTVPALAALGARVTLARWRDGASVRREMPLEDFFVEEGIRRNVLEKGEVVVKLRLPPPDGRLCGYRKYRLRASIDYPLVSLAAALRLRDGRLRDVRVIVGAMASAPVTALATMAALEGRRPTRELLREAADSVVRGTRAMPNLAGTPAHRRLMARSLCRSLLEELAGPPPAESRGSGNRRRPGSG